MSRRFLAEWEPVGAILMALPERDTDWDYMLDEARDCYRRIVETFTSQGLQLILFCHDKPAAEKLMRNADAGCLTILEAEYNDTWTRDYGPLTISEDGSLKALDFGFNGWGLKFASDKDNLVNLRLSEKGVLEPDAYRNNRDYTLEGGSVETDGNGMLLTTSRCLCSPNRNGGLSKDEVEQVLRHRLGTDLVHWLDYGALSGDDTDSHIDTLARVAPGNTIIYVGSPEGDHPDRKQLELMKKQLHELRNREGNPYRLVELPVPDIIKDEEGNNLPATYANYLIANGVVYYTTYGQPENDKCAAEVLQSVFENCKVIGIDCRALIQQHGSLHCATMQLPKEIINL